MTATTTPRNEHQGWQQRREQHHRHSDLEGCAWPDPDPEPTPPHGASQNYSVQGGEQRQVPVDDVSRMSGAFVDRLAFPRTERDVLDLLHRAVSSESTTATTRIGIRGTQHSMGGHAIPSMSSKKNTAESDANTDNAVGGRLSTILVDTKFLARMEYHPDSETVTVGAGCRWSDVIQFLNRFGKSPRTMQSYASFSVGGTLSVNAHGITSDTTLAKDVIQFRLARYLGTSDNCTGADGGSDDNNPLPSTSQTVRASIDTITPSDELFGLVLGGYGLFGIVTEITLRVADNAEMFFDSINLRLLPSSEPSSAGVASKDSALLNSSDDGDEESEFVRVWTACRSSTSNVEVKLARLDILTLESASLYVFRKDEDGMANRASVMSSNLPLRPRELSKMSQLLYKWALPVLQGYRQSQEERTGVAMDMAGLEGRNITKNELLYESATPMARLYSPLIVVNDSFILQEFFVPHRSFSAWIRAARPIYRDIHEYSKNVEGTGEAEEEKRCNGAHRTTLVLLNTTIRYVEYDDISFLKYSSSKSGMFAFVLYFRVTRTEEAETALGQFHNRLATETMNLGGTFYLPYRKCYTSDMLRQAYPDIERFARLKEKYDTSCIFTNQWFEQYVLSLCSDEYRAKWLGTGDAGEESSSCRAANPLTPSFTTYDDFMGWLPNRPTRRKNSYRSLLRNHWVRRQFEEEFLVTIFNVEKPTEVMRVISKAAWDPRNTDDNAIYQSVYRYFNSRIDSGLSMAGVGKGWRSLRQLSHQKRELTRETSLILQRLGMFGRLRGYVSMGDHGKIVLNLKRAGAFAPEQIGEGNAKCYVVHDFDDNDEVSIPCILERGSMHPVGQQIQYDYLCDNAAAKLVGIPDGSVDLVTINQGLHHFPSTKLFGFLKEVHRMIREGGIFILREHDLQEEVTATNIRLKRDLSKAPVEILDLAHSVFNAVTGVPPEVDAEEIRAFRPIHEWRQMLERMGFSCVQLYGIEIGDPTQDFMLCFQKGAIRKDSSPGRYCAETEQLNLGEPPFASTFRALLAQIPSSAASSVSSILDWLGRVLPTILDILSHASGDQLLRSADQDSEHDRHMKRAVALLENVVSGAISQLLEAVGGFQDLLDGIRVRETVDLLGLLSMPELFLILPAMKRKLVQNPTTVPEPIKQFIAIVELYFPALFLEDPTSAVPDRERDVKAPTPVGYYPHDSTVSFSEVKEVLQLVSEAVDFSDPENFLPNSEFTVPQQSALLSFLAASDLDSLSRKVADFCNIGVWSEVKRALVGTDATPAYIGSEDSVALRGELPTKTRLLSAELGHPWRSALRSFLKSPHVKLRQQAVVGLKFIGLGDFLALYNEAKDSVDASGVGNTAASIPVEEATKLKCLVSATTCSNECKEVRLSFNEGHRSYDLHDVSFVLEAQYGYKSLSSKLTDITEHVRKLHDESHVASGETKNRPGWLHLDKDSLMGFRNQSKMSQVGDSLRQAVVGVGSLGLAGRSTLKLKYIALQGHLSNEELSAREDLCSFLEEKALVCGSIHGKDGHFMWFKLAEWMLVDIIEKIGQSLDHTPWYFFPFMECVQLFFSVLFKECKVVDGEFGYSKAYASEAFLTDLIPGAVMAVIFAQLSAMQAPLAAYFPLNAEIAVNIVEEVIFYAAALTSSRENLSMEGDLTQQFRLLVDERILSASLLYHPSTENELPVALYKARIPTYRTMGAVLVQLALRVPSARILQISGHKVVQARVSIDLSSSRQVTADERRQLMDQKRRLLQEINGVTVLFDYSFPEDNQAVRIATATTEGLRRVAEEPKVHLAIRVEVLSLLHLIRQIERMEDVQLQQIYEIYNGW